MKLSVRTQRTILITGFVAAAGFEISIRTAKGHGLKNPWANAALAAIGMGCILHQAVQIADMLEAADIIK